MDKYIDDFINYISNIKKYSNYTCINYRIDLDKFNSYIKMNNINFNDVEYSNIRGYISYLYNLDESNKTITRNISSLRSFYKYMTKFYSFDNPMILITNPKQDKLLPHYLSYDDIETLLKVTSSNDPYDIRNNLIIELLYSTGIRVSELVGIKIEDIDLSDESIKVYGKGKKYRIVYFGKICKDKIIKYLNIRNSIIKESTPYLLINKRGYKLSDRSVRKIFEDLIKLNHLDISFSPHTLRHTYATHMLNGGADIRSVGELLGHSSINTTGIYTHVSNEHLRNVYLKSHPRGK